MLSDFLFAAFLILVSAMLLVRHRQSWHIAARSLKQDRERVYLRTQYRRRMQASATIGIIGALVAGGPWIRGPVWFLAYWTVALLLVLWIGCLALADLVSTRRYYREVHAEQLVEHAQLLGELNRLRMPDGNGQSAHDT